MCIELPQEIARGLDEILLKLNKVRKPTEYRYLIGDPEDAHLTNFDDSRWSCSDKPISFKRHQGVTWFRFDVNIPEKIMDIPVCGSGIRLSAFFFAPTSVYVNGELKLSERTWVDFKAPEVYLTNDAVPGEVIKAAIKLDLGEFSYWDGLFYADLIIDCVEDAEFEISSFKEELIYACRFNEVKAILPEVFDMMLHCLNCNVEPFELVEKIKLAREMLRPMATAAEKNIIHLVGHAHIDMNWFWSMDETHDVIKRDFATMTGIMGEDPEFRFSQSQCAAYEIAERFYPDIFDKMKKYIKSGNWDVTASTWVEGDLNMASGESIVRHILYSKKYLKEKFDIDPRIMWCPDNFGHSANIPQIAKKGGIDYYFFSRCGKENPEPGTDFSYFVKYAGELPLFWWEGLDGSRVLSYNTIYSSDVNSTSALSISNKLDKLYGLKNSMYVYGTGDHGGGPTRRDIRRARQLDGYPTTPSLKFSTTRSFFDSIIEEKAWKIPVEKGELNFTFDGCYTTHADIKRYNRQCENMLASTEVLGTIGKLYGLEYKLIEKEWKTMLFNQFHDIFDGCGVKCTYDYSVQKAEEALNILSGISNENVKHLCSMIKTSDKGIPLAVFNTTGWERSECIKIKKPQADVCCYNAMDADGNMLSVQTGKEDLFIFINKIPPIGYKVIYLNEGSIQPEFNRIEKAEGYFKLNTKYYFIEIKEDSGEIVTLYDRINRKYVVRREEIGWKLKKGVLNTMQVHYEVPTRMSAWTIGAVERIRNLISGAKATIKEDGQVVKIINIEHRFDSSVISQDIIIYNDSPRIDFSTHVDWKEYGSSEKEAPMLKVCFIPDICNQSAAYEIPFGAIYRPCTDIEVPALKWVDISEEGYGFSILNDCKHGHKIRGNAMELTLIRSGWNPDPSSDVGSHEFVYSILPHKDKWEVCDTIKEGYCLNNRLIIEQVKKGVQTSLPEVLSIVSVSSGNAVISAFKPAESGEGIILRLYEGGGIESNIKVKLGFAITRVDEVDLNESILYSRIDCKEKEFEFNLGGFEIKTFKILLE